MISFSCDYKVPTLSSWASLFVHTRLELLLGVYIGLTKVRLILITIFSKPTNEFPWREHFEATALISPDY